MESLSVGTPVITSNFGSRKEIAEGDGALLVDPHDVVAVADAMRSLLTDDALHSELVQRARMRQRTTWDDYAQRLWAVFAEAS